jgi:quercetin dioxygenase-like cupin family protein
MISRFIILVAAALLHGFGSAQAQTSQPSDTAKVLLENEQVRVIEMRFKPGAKFDTQSHPNRFIYGLSDGALLFSPPGKTPYELSFKAGEALWLPAQAMATQNEGDKEVRALVVELKDVRAKGRRSAPAKSAKAAGRAKKSK